MNKMMALPVAAAMPTVVPAIAAQASGVSFPDIVDRLVRIRERALLQHETDRRETDTDPDDEEGNKVWGEIHGELDAVTDAMLGHAPRSLADLAWQAEAVIACDGPDMLYGRLVHGLPRLFENLRAFANPLTVLGPSQSTPAPLADPVFEVIERHKALSVAFDAAADRDTSTPDGHPEKASLEKISGDACNELLRHAKRLFAFQSTTVGGVASLLGYISTLQDWQMPSCFAETKEINGMKKLCRAMATALDPFSAVQPVASPRSVNASVDPIFAAIEAHRDAVAGFDDAVTIESSLERKLPDARRQSAINAHERRIVAGDDPAWPAALQARAHASDAMEDRAIDLLNTDPTTMAGAEALLRYYAEQEEAMFPDTIEGDDGYESFSDSLMRHVADAIRGIRVPVRSSTES